MIVYDTTIRWDLMVQLGLTAGFKQQFLAWYDTVVPMKEPISLLGQTNLNNHERFEEVMHMVDPDSKHEATEIMVKILKSNYYKSDLEQFSGNSTQINVKEKSLLQGVFIIKCNLADSSKKVLTPELMVSDKNYTVLEILKYDISCTRNTLRTATNPTNRGNAKIKNTTLTETSSNIRDSLDLCSLF